MIFPDITRDGGSLKPVWVAPLEMNINTASWATDTYNLTEKL
jgi:hypothetical protein